MKDTITDQTNIGINLKWFLQLIAVATIAAWGYFQVISRIAQLEMDIIRMRDNVTINNEFRVKWPRGEMGSLPDDAKQDLRIEYLQEDVESLQKVVKELEIKLAKQ